MLARPLNALVLGEATTYLDITHQIEVLDLCAELHRRGRTLVAVLHDLNQAACYATHLIATREGAVVTEGPVDIVGKVFDLPCVIIDDPETATPLVIPRSARRGPL